jgi:hypothetical protein
MSQSIILFRQFYFIFGGRLLYKEFVEKNLEKSLCFLGVHFTNLANYWDFKKFQKKLNIKKLKKIIPFH